jgi:hypothetical protein
VDKRKQTPRKAKTATKKSVKEIVDLIPSDDGDDEMEDDNDLNDDNATTGSEKKCIA